MVSSFSTTKSRWLVAANPAPIAQPCEEERGWGEGEVCVKGAHLSLLLTGVLDSCKHHLQAVLDKLLMSRLAHYNTQTFVQESLHRKHIINTIHNTHITQSTQHTLTFSSDRWLNVLVINSLSLIAPPNSSSHSSLLSSSNDLDKNWKHYIPTEPQWWGG